MRREIERKFVVGDKNGIKGVGQLANAIQKLFGVKKADIGDGIDLSGIKRVYPVLIAYDDIAGTLLINHYLNRRFQDIMNKHPLIENVEIRPLVCLSCENVESFSDRLGSLRFCDILEARCREDPSLKMPLQMLRLRTVFPGRHRVLPMVMKSALDDLAAGAARMFFSSRVDGTKLRE